MNKLQSTLVRCLPAASLELSLKGRCDWFGLPVLPFNALRVQWTWVDRSYPVHHVHDVILAHAYARKASCIGVSYSHDVLQWLRSSL